MDALQQMFGQQFEQACHEITKKYMNTKMRYGTHVRDHVMTMANYFNEAKLRASTLDEPTKVSIILNSLPKEFNHFISSYVMHKMNYGMSQLLNEHQTYESICRTTKGGGETKVAVGSSSKSKKRKSGFDRKGGSKAQKSKQDPKDKKAQNKEKGC